jgi:hypothetical protein
VFADPGRFGLATDQNLTATCFSGSSCTENARYGINSATPDPTKLIYNDGVHPTEAGQKLISDYAYSLLAAPWELTLLPEMAHATLRAHQDELRNQWQADWENWQAVGQWRAIVPVAASIWMSTAKAAASVPTAAVTTSTLVAAIVSTKPGASVWRAVSTGRIWKPGITTRTTNSTATWPRHSPSSSKTAGGLTRR